MSMFKFTVEEKRESTKKHARSLIAAGWDREAAIINSQNLWHISEKQMKIMRAEMDEEDRKKD